MFGKLMNYELKYLLRTFAPMWAVVLALCTMTRVTMGPKLEEGQMYIEGAEAVLPAVLVVITVFAIMTMMIVAMVVLLQRFYKGIFGDEGYLMFTLPVTTGQLIHGKGLSAVLMLIVTGAVTVLGVLIVSAYDVLWDEVMRMFGMISYDYDLTAGSIAMWCFWFIAAAIASAAESIYMIYLAITLGQMWRKHPVAGGVVAFYGISLVLSGIGAAFIRIFGGSIEELLSNAVWAMEGGDMLQLSAVVIFQILQSAVLVGIFFLITKLVLDKRLNIQ